MNHRALLVLIAAVAPACKGAEPGPLDTAGVGPPAPETGLDERARAELARLEAEETRLEAELAAVPEAPEDVGWVCRKLETMVAVDQMLRKAAVASDEDWDPDVRQAFMRVLGERTMAVDRRNTAELRGLVERYGWFNVSTFGEDADRNAWLLVQHADQDVAFQKEVLEVLQGLVPLGETKPSNFAYLWDRVAVAEGRPQRYGTQGRCVGSGEWEPHAIEDPARVDELRRSVGLGSLAEYVKLVSELCH